MLHQSQSNNKSIDARSIVDFWFSGPAAWKRWFKRDSEFDAEIKSRFGSLIRDARTSKLDFWTAEPHSTLALIICLDQFPRNVFRGTPDAFSSDSKAREIAAMAITKGFDRKVPLIQQMFFYVPFEHGEDIISQVASLSLFEGLVRRVNEEAASTTTSLDEEQVGFLRFGLKTARDHCAVIQRFRRYPGRNEAMGRQSTAEETEFLKENPGW